MAACGYTGQLPSHPGRAVSKRVSHQTRNAPVSMRQGSAAARLLKGCSWVPAAVPQRAREAARPGRRSLRSASQGRVLRSSWCGSSAGASAIVDAAPHGAALSRALEVKDGDVHVVWCYTDKVHKSLSLWQLFKERFLPRSEVAELGMDGGTSSSDTSKLASQHEQQLAHWHCEGGESTWSHQDERLLARVLTRTTLASAINSLGGGGRDPMLPRDLRFARNTHGKPFLEQPRMGEKIQPFEPDSQCTSVGAPGSQAVAGQQQPTPPTPQTRGWTPQEANPQAVHGRVPRAKTLWTPELGLNAQGLPMLQFNTTHTSGVVGCALAPGNIAVGLDVERLGRVPTGGKLMALARRRFAAAECALLEACADETQQARLFSYLWSLKEAALKARGTGISAPPGLRGFAIGLHPWQHRHADEASQTLDLSGALQQLCPGLRDAPESQHVWKNTTGPNRGSTTQSVDGSSHRSGAPLFHITMQPGAGLEGSDAEQPCYHFLLFHLGTQHVGALCLAVPPGLVWTPAHETGSKTGSHTRTQAVSLVPGHGNFGCVTGAAVKGVQQAAAVPSPMTNETTNPLVRIHFWEGLPQPVGHDEEREFGLSAAPVQTNVAASDGGLGSGDCSAGLGRTVVLVGCTAS